MELDELKKTWDAIDRHMQKETITNSEQILKLITLHKTKANKYLKKIVAWQRFSFIIAILAMIICIVCAIWILPACVNNLQIQQKASIYLLFIGISLLLGGWWDWKMYRQIQQIHIDEMNVSEVSRRMIKYKQCMRQEVIGICIWAIAFNILNYWAMNYYQKPLSAQAILIGSFILIDAIILYLVYQKIVYKYLNDIRKHIKELKEICNE